MAESREGQRSKAVIHQGDRAPIHDFERTVVVIVFGFVPFRFVGRDTTQKNYFPNVGVKIETKYNQ